MDLMSALSVAGTIVQFVDFGSKLIQNGYGLYNSSRGTLPANQELDLIAADLQSVLSKLRTSAEPTDLVGPLTQEDCKGQLSFENVCEGAATVAEELLQSLDTLKVRGKKYRKLSSLQKALENLWSREEIGGIVKRLATYKQALMTRVLLLLMKTPL